MTFWNLGFSQQSSIDALLNDNSEPGGLSLNSDPTVTLSLEQLLDEDELLQECKSTNARLLEFLAKLPVVKRLLGYVVYDDDSPNEWTASPTGSVQYDADPKCDIFGVPLFALDDTQRVKYPYLCVEILLFDLWTVDQVIFDFSNNILASFWGAILDRDSSELSQSSPAIIRWVRVNSAWFSTHPSQMMEFLHSHKDLLSKWINHLGTSSDLSELFFRMIQSDAALPGPRIANVLSSLEFIPTLISFLSPNYSPNVHANVCELLKSIISFCSGKNVDPFSNNSSSIDTKDLSKATESGPGNLFLLELTSTTTVSTLFDFINHGLQFQPSTSSDHDRNTKSSLTSSIIILIDLIRKNNSDYTEQQILAYLKNISDKINPFDDTNNVVGDGDIDDVDDEFEPSEGVVSIQEHEPCIIFLTSLLDIAGNHLEELKNALIGDNLKAQNPVSTQLGKTYPLTFERYRICELVAELLHCSNMTLWNRIDDNDTNLPRYDPDTGKIVGNTQSFGKLESALKLDPSTFGSSFLSSSSKCSLPAGPAFRSKILDHQIFSTLLDLFVEYPWNNFLHATIYDSLLQILSTKYNYNVDSKLVVSLFVDCEITNRLINAYNENENAEKEQNRPRIGYMGHLIKIIEQVNICATKNIKSSNIKSQINPFVQNQDWIQLIDSLNSYTKIRDGPPLGGQGSNVAISRASITTTRSSSPPNETPAQKSTTATGVSSTTTSTINTATTTSTVATSSTANVATNTISVSTTSSSGNTFKTNTIAIGNSSPKSKRNNNQSSLVDTDEGFPDRSRSVETIQHNISNFRLGDPPSASVAKQNKVAQQQAKLKLQQNNQQQSDVQDSPSSSTSSPIEQSASSDKFSRYLAEQVSSNISGDPESTSSSSDDESSGWKSFKSSQDNDIDDAFGSFQQSTTANSLNNNNTDDPFQLQTSANTFTFSSSASTSGFDDAFDSSFDPSRVNNSNNNPKSNQNNDSFDDDFGDFETANSSNSF